MTPHRARGKGILGSPSVAKKRIQIVHFFRSRQKGERGQDRAFCRCRKCLTHLTIRSAEDNPSEGVFAIPKLNRKLLSTTPLERPIATSVLEGSLEPLAQAEPVEQQMPAASSARNSACRSTPKKARQLTCGRRGLSRPITTTSASWATISASNASRQD